MVNSPFQHNLSLFSKFFPQESVFFSNLEEKLSADISKESLNIDEELIEKQQALYVYGIPSLLMLKKLRLCLERFSLLTLVVLEDDPLYVASFFHLKEATFFLTHPHFRLFFFQDIESPVLEKLYFETLATQFLVLKTEGKEEKRRRALEEKLLYDAAIRSSFSDEYYKFGASFFKNYYPNLFELPNSLYGRAFFNQFKGVPAIICGAGPSLNKQISKLNPLLEKAIVFAGGSALNAVISGGVNPHFGVGVDPNSLQEQRLNETAKFKTPFFYRSRVFYKALQKIKGEKIFIGGSGGYDIAPWVEEQLGLPEETLEEGYNVVNFSIELAVALGCNPIIFIGADLAFTDKEAYAKGIVDDVVLKEEAFQKGDIDETLLLRKDIFGNPIYTLWKWIAESVWISDYKNNHLEIDFINATEGGIGFPSVLNLSFDNVIEKYLQKDHFLEKRLLEVKKKAHFPHPITKAKIIEVLDLLKKSMERAIGYLEELLHLEGKTEKRGEDPLKNLFPSFSKQEYLETLLEEEPCYQAILMMFLAVFTKGMTKQLRELQIEEFSLSPEEVEKRYEHLKRERLLFLQNTLKANIYLLQDAIHKLT